MVHLRRVVGLLILVFCLQIGYSQKLNQLNIDSLFEAAIEQQFSNLDSALSNFHTCLDVFVANQDSLRIIETQMMLMSRYTGKGNYLKAYDIAWSVLPLTAQSKYILKRIEVYVEIASLYLIFEQYSKAHQYHNIALDLTQRNLVDDQQKTACLGRLYNLKAWLISEETANYKLAEEALFTSISHYEKLNDNRFALLYAKLHMVELYTKMGKFDEGEDIVLDLYMTNGSQIAPWHSLLFHHMGFLYAEKKDYNRAILYLEKSLTLITKFKNHLDLKGEVLEKLAEIYANRNENKKAYNYISKAKKLSEELFGSHSSKNKELLEIKDKYELEIQRNETEIRTHKLVLLENEKELWKLRIIIYTATFIFVIISIVWFFSIKTRRQKAKQLLMIKKQELERKTQHEIIEIKNKEIMCTALQLMERDQLMDEFKTQLRQVQEGNNDTHSIFKILSSIKIDKKKNWSEFEIYFASINDNYYKILKLKHPKLTSTDLKICAFIKMGFSSKEMSHIMGIGVDGLNTSRSRIRKKMNIDRTINLFDYLQDIGNY